MHRRTIKVAVVDDHPLLREQASRILALLGYQIMIEACNGQDLLAKVEAAGGVPDLFLVDINMPVMNGPETVRHLRLRYPLARILAFSSFVDQKSIEEMIQNGADGFLNKNSDFENWEKMLGYVSRINK